MNEENQREGKYDKEPASITPKEKEESMKTTEREEDKGTT